MSESEPHREGRRARARRGEPPGASPAAPVLFSTGPISRGTLHPAVRALLFVAYWYLLFHLLPDIVYRFSAGLSDAARMAEFYVLLNLAVLAGSGFFLARLDRRSFRTLGLWFYKGWGREFAAGVGIGAGLLVVTVAGMVGIGAVHYHGLAARAAGNLPGVASYGGVLLLAAVFEELAFRGYGFQRLLEALEPPAAVAAFSALFGLVHLENPHATPLGAANTMLSGVLLAVAYLKTRGLWLPIGLHWAWNYALGPLASLPLSGMEVRATLLRAEQTGASWLNGGAYGPEGSVVFSLVCAGGIVWLVRTRCLTPSVEMQEVLK